MPYTNNEVSIMKDNSIKAVYDSDLEALLKKLNVYDDVTAKKCHCIYCGTTITVDNIDGIVPNDNEVVFSCNTPACRAKLLEEMSTK